MSTKAVLAAFLVGAFLGLCGAVVVFALEENPFPRCDDYYLRNGTLAHSAAFDDRQRVESWINDAEAAGWNANVTIDGSRYALEATCSTSPGSPDWWSGPS